MIKPKYQTEAFKAPWKSWFPSIAKSFLESFENTITQMSMHNSKEYPDVYDEINKNINNIKICLNILSEKKGNSVEHKVDLAFKQNWGTSYLLVSQNCQYSLEL